MFGLGVSGCGRRRPFVGTLFSSGLFTIGLALSAAGSVMIPTPSMAQDALQPGHTLALEGPLPGHAACASCHLESGAGQADAGIPRIGGLSASYIKQQLNAFASGVRPSAWMTQYAKQLSPQQIDDVAAYYAAQTPADETPQIATTAEQIAYGEQLYKKGNMAAHVMACAGCHGPAGHGAGAMFPAIAEQSAPYTVTQLTNWKAGTKRDPMDKMMISEVHGLTDPEIEALAAYIYMMPKMIPPAAVPPK